MESPRIDATVGADFIRDKNIAELNPKHDHIEHARNAGIFLGYRISRAGFSPGRKLRRSMKKKIRLAAAKGPDALIRCLRSYQGLCLF